MRNTDHPYRLGVNQEVTVGAASAATTNVFGTQTRWVRVCSTTACRVRIGKNPTAVATDPYLPANFPQVFIAGEGEKAAFIQESAGGKATVTELSK